MNAWSTWPGFFLPSKFPLSLGEDQGEGKPMSSTRSTLLLADDDPTIADSLAPFLERAGFHVLVVSDGVSALEKAQAHHPELIILDVLMPRMDGRETLRRLRKAKIWTPTILLTQVGEASERALALEEGADDYLNKPFDTHE
jgi:DNA-binding response OmpR family regulator